LVVPKRTELPEGIHFGHQHLGVCSSTTVDGDRAYVVTSAGDVVCLDVNGQSNGNDGPYTDEARYMVGHGEEPVELSDRDADIVWWIFYSWLAVLPVAALENNELRRILTRRVGTVVP
jgi:hypothetical protein